MTSERLNKKHTILLLLILGIVFEFVRMVFLLLPATFLFDGLLYGLAGYILGNHLYYGRWRWGFVLALPAMFGILYYFITASTATAESNVALRNILSFIVIPITACAGIWLKNNNIVQHH